MASQWPLVKSWLVEKIPTLPGLADVAVYAGPPTTSESAERYVTVGFVADDNGGMYIQERWGDGSVWLETGEVRSQIVAQVGDTDPAISEGLCFAIADALDSAIRTGRNLDGTLSAEGTCDSSVEVHSVSNANGTATALVHVLRYTTTT
jgi:hypothetical protein